MASTKPSKRNLKTQKILGNKDLDMERYLHDAKSSLRAVSNVLELIDSGYDFSTKQGQEILAEVGDAVTWMAKALNVEFKIKDRRKPAGS
jgi:hypothetical protein